MLRRAVLTLLFGAGIPILALSYMAVRSITIERGEDQRKVAATAQRAAERVANDLNDHLVHLEGALADQVKDALRATPQDPDDDEPGDPGLNATGRAVAAALENLRRAEPLVRQAFIAVGPRLLHPATRRSPAPREPDPAERSYVAEAIARAERDADPNEADRTLYFAWNGVKDPGLRAALRVAQAELRARGGFTEEALKLLQGVRDTPDVRGLDQEPLYPAASIRFAEIAEKAGDKETALGALLDLADAVAEDRWHEESIDRRPLLEAVIGEAERLADTLGSPAAVEARRRVETRKVRAEFLEGFEDTILRDLRAHVVYPGPGEAVGPPLRTGTIVGDRDPRLLATIGVIASITRDVAGVSSARLPHRSDPRFLAGVDVDFEKLRSWAQGEVAATMSTTETRVTILDGWNRVFAGDPDLTTLDALKFEAVIPFAKQLPGWHVLAVPRDPEGPARAARRKLTISIALVATCALAALGAFSLALRAAAREVEVAKVRGDLVRNVSHELRTPVASIQMLSEMLEEGGLDATKQQEYHGRIAREARRLARLIENVLDLARVERGARKVEPVPMLLGGTLGQAVELFRESEQGREANVVFHDRSNGAVVPLDSSTVEQIVGNLLSNAVKYSPAGSEITVECSVAEKAVISVRDRGRGMTHDESQRLFNPFYRARPEDAAATGVGLGLVITRELIRLHGGELSVVSAPGQGTTFTITLPRGTA
ncbi:MAG: ATP-binding protein [Planctomycetota bacterium]